MTPTVLVDYGPQRQIKRSYDEISYRAAAPAASTPRGYAETVGESGSPVEDSSAPKRKCISLNGDGFEMKREVFIPSKLSSSERRRLRQKFRTELDTIRGLLKKPEFVATVLPVTARAPAFSSSATPRPKKVKQGSHVIRGAGGRFLPTKPRPEPSSAAFPEATVMKQCEAILKKLMTQKCSHIFNVPVDVERLNIPDYNDIIKNPMDLGSIKHKLDSGSYTSPSDFAADVRLTFNNAITYNPRGHAVHDMAIQLNKMFEARWKTVEKKLASVTTARPPHVEVAMADSKRRKTPPVDRSDLSMECVGPTDIAKPKMTDAEKESFGNCLATLTEDPDQLPGHILDLLQQCIPSNPDEVGDGEVEVDIHSLSDDVLLELKKHVDKFLEEKDHQRTKSEPSENEAVGVSGLSNSSTDPCKGGEPVEEDVDICGNTSHKGGEPVEEDVDICGNTSPILIEKDPQIKTSKPGSPSSSSSDSGSSSDSDSGSDTESESEKVGSPAKLAKAVTVPEQTAEQEKSDVISPVDANHNAADVELHEQDNESKAAPEGENAKPDSQVSPDKLLRAAVLKGRYADTIVKAQGILSQGEGGDTQEELEKLQKEEKARLLAEGNAAMEARRAEAEAESKRMRDLEREKARQALQDMERTVEINDNVHPKDLEMLGAATTEHIVSSVDETSPEHSQDGMPSFLPGSGNMLEKFGLYMKVDEEEDDDEEEPIVPSSKDGEEGEVN